MSQNPKEMSDRIVSAVMRQIENDKCLNRNNCKEVVEAEMRRAATRKRYQVDALVAEVDTLLTSMRGSTGVTVDGTAGWGAKFCGHYNRLTKLIKPIE